MSKSQTLPNRNISEWVMVAILLLATALRWLWLSAQSIAFDESFSLVVSSANWPNLFRAILSDGVHPPLFYMIHKSVLALWGTSEFGQRFSAAVFSIMGVALVYWAGRIIFDRKVGLVAALLLALNPLHIWLAQEARMYSLFAALTIVSMTSFWLAIRRKQRRYWVVLTVANSLIFGLHYFGFLIPTIQFGFIILTFGYNHRNLRAWVLAQIIAAGPLIPWLIATAQREAQTFGIGFLVRPSVPDFFITLWNLAIGASNIFWPATLLAIIVVCLGLLMTLRPLPPHHIQLKQARQLLWLWVLLPLLITWLVSQRRSFYADRYLSFIIPGLALLLAVGLSRLTQLHWRMGLLGGLIIASGYGFSATQLDPAFQKDNWRGVASYISQNEQPQDVILLYTTHIKFAFDYYYQGYAPSKPLSLNLESFKIESLTAGHRRVWVVYPYTRRPTHYPPVIFSIHN